MNITMLIISGLLLIAAGCAKKNDTTDLLKKAVIGYVDLKDVISQTGEIQPVIKVELKSEASGKIDSLFVKEGEELKKGAKILKIDPTRLLTQKSKLDLAVKKARLSFALAKRDYDNARKLFNIGQVSGNKLEDLKNAFELKEIDLEEKVLELDDVKYQLSKTLITAPMAGVLISLLVEEGEIAVSATSGFSGGTAIGTIADITKLEVVTQIGEVDYAKIRAGQTVDISMESNRRAATKGKVSFVSLAAKKEANSNISSFEVRIAIDSLFPGLVPGVNVNVDFVVLDRKRVLGVPFSMVQKQERNGRETFIVMRPEGTKVSQGLKAERGGPDGENGGKGPKRRFGGSMGKRMDKKRSVRMAAVKALNLLPSRVKLGDTDYRFYEVLEGLNSGDTVVKILGGQN